MPESGRSGMRSIDATIAMDGAERTIEGHGNGPIAAYVDALTRNCGVTITVRDYHQHAIGHGADASSVTYIEAERDDGPGGWGGGISPNNVAASLKAVTREGNRAEAGRGRPTAEKGKR